MSIPAGTRLGRYEIRTSIGAGGMGEVYLAFDTQLDRLVALKILPAELATDEQRMGRFTQEAKAASALNHPNIVTIYESGKTDITAFIATEFVDGVTLRQRMKQAPMKLSEVLDISIQVASALSAAHAAGVVHRDMKPENVMIRPDGYIKVVDFGLAKLAERKRSDSGASTLIDTEPGVVMGTARYMSPEQARGLEVDARTDVWSLGVIIYEMCAERPPFAGATNSDVLASILEREPPPLTRYSRDVPESLEWIVSKSLNKEREERYQTAKELLSDLRKLKRREDFDAEAERSTPPELNRSGPFATTPISAASKQSEIEIGGIVAAPTASSAEYIVREVKRHKWAVSAVAAFAFVALVGVGWGLYKIIGNHPPPPPPPREKKIEKLTTAGNVTEAAISPNGEWLAFATDERGTRRLWLRDLSTRSDPVSISQTTTGGFAELSFSKDNRYIYYATSPQPGEDYQLIQIPRLGGNPNPVASLADMPEYTFSPDGSQIAFVSAKQEGEIALIVANSDGTNPKRLASHTLANRLASPVWSPDGKTIACVSETADGDLYMSVVTIAVDTGKEETITAQKWRQIDKVTWLGDSTGLLLSAQEKVFSQIWKVSYPGGQATSITTDLNDYSGLAVTSNAESESLVTLKNDASASLCINEKSSADRCTPLPFSGNRDVSSFDWTADGRIVYEAKSGEGSDIWIVGANDTSPKHLTSDWFNRTPSVSQEGSHIVFMRGEQAERDAHIWRMDLDGGNKRALTKGVGESNPCISADGQWIVYKADVSGSSALWKISIDGGTPVRLTDHASDFPVISPDGKTIACAYQPDGSSTTKVALIPFEGGQPLKLFDITSAGSLPVRWTSDGRVLAYVEVRDGVSNIWIQPIDGGPAKKITDFKSDSIFWFDWSRDGKLALTRGNSTSDVVRMSNFR